MSNALVIGSPEGPPSRPAVLSRPAIPSEPAVPPEPAVPSQPAAGDAPRPGTPRRGVAVWCDRAILGHGVAAVVGRTPELGQPLWIGEGLHEPPQRRQLLEVAVLVAVWDSPQVWPVVRERLPVWLATGVSVVLVAPAPQPADVPWDPSLTRVQWCSPRASAAELTAAVRASVAAAQEGATRRITGAPRREGPRTAPALSEQEQRVLELVTTGLKVSAVARRLEVSPHTVHTYLRRIRRKFAEAGTPVASPLELYRAATLWRLVGEPPSSQVADLWASDTLGSAG